MGRESYRGEGIILRRVDFGEKDQIVTLLLREVGRRDCVAYGAKVSRKRFAGALDLFRLVEFTYTEGKAESLPALSEATVLEDYRGIETSFEKVAFASYATEFARELLRVGEGADDLLDIMLEYYRHVETAADDALRLECDLYSLILHLLQHTGFGPSLEHCYISGKRLSDEEPFHFSKTGEGIVRAASRQPGQSSMPVSYEALITLAVVARGFLLEETTPPPASLMHQIRPLVQILMGSVIQRELKSAKTLALVLA